MKTLDEVNKALIKVIGRRDARIQIQSEEIIRLERERVNGILNKHGN